MSDEDKERNAEENDSFYIVGIWAGNTFEPILEELEEVKKDIELEFREIYGTQ